jgi:hypothetical protein
MVPFIKELSKTTKKMELENTLGHKDCNGMKAVGKMENSTALVK